MYANLKIGVTGGIGSGKSLLCDYFEQQGFPVIRADRLAKELMATDLSVRSAIIAEFGTAAYTPEGTVNTAYLASKVFAGPGNVKRINRIVHPAVIAANASLTEQYLAVSPIVFHEAALIFEARMAHHFNFTLLVWAPAAIALARAAARDGVPEALIRARGINQLPLQQKLKRADVAVSNAGSREELFEKGSLLLRLFKGMLYAA